jgi:hypothetical protein
MCAGSKTDPGEGDQDGREVTASEARHFVVGNLFSYICFDGTHGSARPFSRWLHPISKRRAKLFSASHATLDPDRACSAAQDGTLSLSKAAIRLTQMMKAGHTFSYVRSVIFSLSVTITTACRERDLNPVNHNHRRPQCGIPMTALQHWIQLRRTLVFGVGVLPQSHRFAPRMTQSGFTGFGSKAGIF